MCVPLLRSLTAGSSLHLYRRKPPAFRHIFAVLVDHFKSDLKKGLIQGFRPAISAPITFK
jgi:hypothetical protein